MELLRVPCPAVGHEVPAWEGQAAAGLWWRSSLVVGVRPEGPWLSGAASGCAAPPRRQCAAQPSRCLRPAGRLHDGELSVCLTLLYLLLKYGIQLYM